MTHHDADREQFLDDAASLVDGDEATRIRHATRLAGDAASRDLVFDLEAVADAVGQAGVDHQPPPDLGARVLAAIAAHDAAGPTARAEATASARAILEPLRTSSSQPRLAARDGSAGAGGRTRETRETARRDASRRPFGEVPEPRDRHAATDAAVAAGPRSSFSKWLAGGVTVTATLATLAAAAFLLVERSGGTSPRGGAQADSAWTGTVESAWPDAAGLTIRGARRGADRHAIGAGSVVRTDERTRARLRLADGTMMMLEHDTELVLESGGRRARLARGAVLADVAHLERSGASIGTPHGLVEVLGTKFLVTTSDGGTSVRVLRGRVRLTNSGRSVEVAPGEEGIAAPGEGPSRMLASMPVSLALDDEDDSSSADEDGEQAVSGLGELRARRPGESAERERPLTLAEHSVTVRIVGPVARTEIEETFRNDDDVTLEGVYRFPLPPGARIANLALEVDGRWEEGAFVARERAVQIFRGVVRQAIPQQQQQQQREEFIWVPGPWRDPALLEWKRGGRFELRIFPIAARSVRRVRIAYEESVPLAGASRRYSYPLPSVRRGEATVGRFSVDVRVAGHAQAQPVRASGYPFTLRADGGASRLAFSRDAFAPSGGITIEYGIENPGAELRSFAYRGPAVAPVSETSRDPEEVKAAQAALALDDRGYVAFALRPEMPRESVTNETDYAIVVDSSQSMTGERFVRARRLVGSLVQELDRRHRVTVLACDLACRAAPGDLVMPSSRAAASIDAFLASVQPGGSSNLLVAMVKGASAVPASNDRRRVVIYVGDGVASSGLTDVGDLAREARALASSTGVSMTTVGIGDDADSRMLAAIAREGGGFHVDFTPGEGSMSTALAVLETTYAAALEQPTLEFPAGVEAMAPTELPTLLPGREFLVSARYRGDVSGDVVLRGKLGGRAYERRYPIRLDASANATNAFVPRTWAAARIADLELHGSNATTRVGIPTTAGVAERAARTFVGSSPEAGVEAELVALSKGYGVISRSTSLLVLESEAMFRAYGVERATGQAAWTGDDADEITADAVEPDAPADDSGALGSLGSRGREGSGAPAMARSATRSESFEFNPYGDVPAAEAAPAPRQPPSGGGGATTTTTAPQNRPAAPAVMPPPPRGPGRYMRVMWVRDAAIARADGVSARDLNLVANARTAHAASPDSRDKTRDLVRALARAGRLDEAAVELAHWLERDPNDVEGLVLASDVAGRLGKSDEALRTLAGAVDADPSDPAMHERLALALERQGRTDQACAFRLSLASIRRDDEPTQRLAQTCASRLALVHARASIDTRVAGLARRSDATAATGDVERVRGELVVDATFSGADLDLSIVTPRGERASGLGGPRGVTASTVAGGSSESLGLRSARSGTYYIEVARRGEGGADVSGVLRIRALDTTRSIPFVLRGDHAMIARVDLTRRRVLINR